MVVEDDRRRLYELQIRDLREMVMNFRPQNIHFRIEEDLDDHHFDYQRLKEHINNEDESSALTVMSISEKAVANALEQSLVNYFSGIAQHCKACKMVEGVKYKAPFEKKCNQSDRFGNEPRVGCLFPNIDTLPCNAKLKEIIRKII